MAACALRSAGRGSNEKINMEFDACRDEGGTRKGITNFWGEELNRRRAGDSVTANRVEAELLVFGDCEAGDCDGRLRCNLRGGRRDGYVAGVADLAMLFVGGMPVPVACRLHGKQAHGKNQGHGQQS